MELHYGDVYYINPAEDERRTMYTSKTALLPGRPGVIVSSPTGMNRYQVMVVLCTTKAKPDNPCNFTLSLKGRTSTVLCNEIQTVDVSQIGDFIASLSDTQLNQLNTCLHNSLGCSKSTDSRILAQIRKLVSVPEVQVQKPRIYRKDRYYDNAEDEDYRDRNF